MQLQITNLSLFPPSLLASSPLKASQPTTQRKNKNPNFSAGEIHVNAEANTPNSKTPLLFASTNPNFLSESESPSRTYTLDLPSQAGDQNAKNGYFHSVGSVLSLVADVLRDSVEFQPIKTCPCKWVVFIREWDRCGRGDEIVPID